MRVPKRGLRVVSIEGPTRGSWPELVRAVERRWFSDRIRTFVLGMHEATEITEGAGRVLSLSEHKRIDEAVRVYRGRELAHKLAAKKEQPDG